MGPAHEPRSEPDQVQRAGRGPGVRPATVNLRAVDGSRRDGTLGLAQDPAFREWWAAYLRLSASPSAAVALGRMNSRIDVSSILPTVRVPTLVMHRVGDRDVRVEEAELERFRGREIKTTGDGLLATFDGPARAIRCALAVRDPARRAGLELRAGLHTGECETLPDDIGGIAVHIASRVVSEAAPGAVLVSRTVRDLVAGSGIEFEDRGSRALKGLDAEWQLFSAVA